jgi:hypothetical protein
MKCHEIVQTIEKDILASDFIKKTIGLHDIVMVMIKSMD